MSLSRSPGLSDYTEQKGTGARFLLKFKKGRGLKGADLEEIEAKLGTDRTLALSNGPWTEGRCGERLRASLSCCSSV